MNKSLIKCWLMILCILVGWGWEPVIALALDNQSPSLWTKQSLHIRDWVQEGTPSSYLKARSQMKELAIGFSQADLSTLDVSVQGIRALSNCLVTMEEELNRVMPQQGDANRAAIQLTLAFDAVSHSNQPMWVQYEAVFKKDIAKVKGALKNNKREAVAASLKELIAHVELVMPALEVSRQPGTVQKVKSVLQFFRSEMKKKGAWNTHRLSEPLKQWENMLTPLIHGPEEEVVAVGLTNFPPVIPAAILMGTVIALVLGYVGWRNYRGSYQRVRGRI
ncbi:sporulation protein YpjB [Marininema halotolerans]|uniref:Sporulation protein YpjB n=1 Tax=Marininema halotolerans TaxID=1155944 RepID=A0A1I6U0C0_9BACL|nr:sporulation protein YpjB [Marininema halotolerans]SFS94737.1 sporulation protein YpjB [Marininema halotolerans]